MKNIIILDTSILCVWLKVPGKNTCGSGNDIVDFENVDSKLKGFIDNGALLVLPLAVIIETGNHIAQAPGDRHVIANTFADFILGSIRGETPWELFTNQTVVWDDERFELLVERWRNSVNTEHSFGDASIVDIANYYKEIYPASVVYIYTGDKGLEAYSPNAEHEVGSGILIPRRRKNR